MYCLILEKKLVYRGFFRLCFKYMWFLVRVKGAPQENFPKVFLEHYFNWEIIKEILFFSGETMQMSCL